MQTITPVQSFLMTVAFQIKVHILKPSSLCAPNSGGLAK